MTKTTGGLGSKAKRRITTVATLLVLAFGGYAYYRYRERTAPPPVTYQTAAIEKRKIVGRVTATGTVQARVTVLVGSQVSGRIKTLHADFNSSVKKGQLVAKIDPTLFEANVAQAQANYLAAKADLEKVKAQKTLAERQLARLRSLGKDQLATAADIDAAETNVSVASSQILAAEASIAQTAAALRQAQTNLSFTNIVSPIDGTVISRSVDVGQTVAASLQAPTIFTIAEDLRKMSGQYQRVGGGRREADAGHEGAFHGRRLSRKAVLRRNRSDSKRGADRPERRYVQRHHRRRQYGSQAPPGYDGERHNHLR
ncbi:MAG: efflux RND transporter periplasmic adaptor subunit [Polyangiaceae bacterium]